MGTVDFKYFGQVEAKRSYFSYHFSNGMDFTSFSDNDCVAVYDYAKLLAKQLPDLQFFVGLGKSDRWVINGSDDRSNVLVRIALESVSAIPY